MLNTWGGSKGADEPSAAAMAGNFWEQEICENLKADSDITFVEVLSDSKKKSQSIKDIVRILKELDPKSSPNLLRTWKNR